MSDTPPNSAGTATIVIHPVLKRAINPRDDAAQLQEAVGLAAAIDLGVIMSETVPVARPVPATLLGQGQVQRIAGRIEELEAQLVVVNHALSPVQQRNLEKELKCKVIDRTGLILEIFGARARTREGQLQVELAALTYQRSRLVRSWTHLERQRGGFGFLGGPGESQIELDRRMIGTRIDKIKRELEDVRRTRGLQRRARTRREQPVVALIGYTNAGKSTLFNYITSAGVLAKDLLFATLDPTMRRVDLGQGRQIMLSDTVGFISDLPTHLVESFRATLEEVTEADIILHVRDIAHEDTDAQRQDVMEILSSLGIEEGDSRIVEVLNKMDLMSPDKLKLAEESIPQRQAGGESIVPISALTGEGVDDLLRLVDRKLFSSRQTLTLIVPHTAGQMLAWLYEHGDVLSREETDDGSAVTVEFAKPAYERFCKLFGYDDGQEKKAV